MTPNYRELNKLLGNLDLYLLDQILKGTFEGKEKILDIGCGEGRNIKYFIDSKYQVTGVDSNMEAINFARLVYKNKAEFINSGIEELSYNSEFDAVLCINVLHHSRSEQEFINRIKILFRSLKKGGVLFIRTLIAPDNEATGDNKNEYFLISRQRIKQLVQDCHFQWQEPLKVENWEGFNLGVIILKKLL